MTTKPKVKLPPFLLRLKRTNPKEYKRMLELCKAGLDLKTWEKIREEYKLN